jgi:hypothetical protein
MTMTLDSLLWRPFFTFTRFAPLGIRFWDAVGNRQVADSLIVDLRENIAAARPLHATRTNSGVYAFQNVPGLRDLEFPRPGVPAPAPRTFILTVLDVAARFTPIAFTLDLPLAYRGLFRANGPETPGFLLFSAPTRPTTAEIGAVRAQLVNDNTEQPAANAVLEVEIDTRDADPLKRFQQWYGIADERGIVSVLIPYPGFRPSGGGGAGTLPSAQHWDVKVHVFYRPASLPALPGLSQPDLRAVINQRAARADFRFQDSSTGNEINTLLVYGADLVLRSRTVTVGGVEVKTVRVIPTP